MNYRSVFISDIHLGTSGCKDTYLLSFLKNNTYQNLYLVGDILDFWKLNSSLQWIGKHNDIIKYFLKQSQQGVNITYIIGNHDEVLSNFSPINFGDIKIVRMADHTLANDKKIVLFHGDQFDAVITKYKWLAVLGAYAYDFLIWLNNINYKIRKFFGMKYWSLSKYLKDKVKKAVQVITHYEEIVTEYAEKMGYDGVICGHIHKPSIKSLDNIMYCNCGDWVENCSALVEDFDGNLEIVVWENE